MRPIVGRAAEQATIAGALSRTADGAGALLLVGGPAGIGKSALADMAVAEASRAGLRVARGYAVDDPGAPPLWPWRRVLPSESPSGSRRRPPLGDGDAAARFELFARLVDELAAQARHAGLLVLLEDMHWADRLSVLLLRHMAAELANLRICLVATYRNNAAGEFSAALPDLLRTPSGRLLSLSGLSVAEIDEWLPDLIGRRDNALAAAVHQRTAGNPLLVRLLAEAVGAAASQEDEDVLVRQPQLRRLIADRAAILNPDDREVIDAAAVLGERLSPHVLSRMVQVPSDRVQDALMAAVASGVLREAADGLRFEHALVRDAIYGEIATSRRGALHAAAARALAAAGAPASSIAAHWHRADESDAAQRCATFADLACRQAQEAMAFDDAARFGELALASSRAAGSEAGEQSRLLLRLAECQMLANRLEAAVRSCAEAADLAEAADRTDLLCQAAIVVHGSGHPLVFEVIPDICRRALERLPPSEHAMRARLLAQIAVAESERGDGARGAELAGDALEEAERSEDATATIEALAARHLAMTIPTRVGERLELGRRAVELGASAARPMAALWGHLWRADASLQLGNLLEFDRELAAIDRVATARGSALARWHHLRFRAERAALVGDFGAARAADRAALELASRVGDVSLLGLSHAFAIHLALVRGDAGELPDDWPQILAQAPPIPLVTLSGVLAHALQGETELAAAEFAPFRDLPRTYPLGVRWAGTMLHTGMAAVMVNDGATATAVLEVLRPTAKYYAGDGSGAVFNQGAIARLLGELAVTAGRLDEALSFYRDAVAMNARIGARPFVALGELGWARALVASGHSRDPVTRRSVGELVTGARHEFARLDMPRRVAMADAFAVQSAAAGQGISPLSPREREVADLVAQALSNREIAGRLFVSERTVESHVRSILTKLGFTTRTEIATWSLTR